MDAPEKAQTCRIGGVPWACGVAAWGELVQLVGGKDVSCGMAGKRFGDVDDHVGRRLRARRKEFGISQEKLADALGISYQQISKCESGVNRVSASRLWDIAQALEVDVGYFFEGIKKRTGRPRKPSAGRPVGAKTARRKGQGARR